MTTSRTVPLWTEIRQAERLSNRAIWYFRERLKNRLHQLVLREYLKLAQEGFTKADLARRIDQGPGRINRLLGAPGNWTLDTVSDLLLAMGCELDPKTLRKLVRVPRAFRLRHAGHFIPRHPG